MRYLRFLLLGAACILAIQVRAGNAPEPDGGNAVDDANVNSRYTVESIDVAGQHDYTLSQPVLNEIHGLVGTRLDFEALTRLARAINREVHARGVSVRLMRGSAPEYVRVILEVNEGHNRFDISVPKFLWHSSEGWTAEGKATATVGNNSVSFGLASNADDLLERYAGYNVSFERRSLGSDKVSFAFLFEDYHQEWNQATLAAAETDPQFLYRSRRNVEPEVTWIVARGLSMTAGVSLESLEPQAGGQALSANAVTGTVKYHRTVEGSALNQNVDASYSVRAATHELGSDFAYARHMVKGRYTASHNRHEVEVGFEGGAIVGNAPMFERFAPGNSGTLRGWNKFDVDPLGGTRVADGSLAYKYGPVRVFYDAGAVWDRGDRPEVRQSLGAGLEGNLGFLGHNEFLLAFAFPLNQGRLEPVFVAGMNF